MRIQYLNGGLANQAFQYIFARFAELYYPDGGKVYLDDSFFFYNHVHNGYELNKVFGIKANLLSDYFTDDVWQAIVQERKKGTYLVDIFKKLGIDYQGIYECRDIQEPITIKNDSVLVKMETFIPDIVKTKVNTIYHGYWIMKDWFQTYQNVFMDEFCFPAIIDEKNKQYLQDIEDTMSVAFHVRKGDYVTLNVSLPEWFYKETAERVLSKYPDAVFFVFSDDTIWCKEHEKELGFDKAMRTVYVEVNTNGNNYRDLQLMTMCKGIILSNSAFSYLAGLLNKQKIFWQNFYNRML